MSTKKTKSQKIIDGLLASGMNEVPSKNKYRVFRATESSFYFVGKNGALRNNDKPAAVGSYSMEHLVNKYIKKGEGANAPKAEEESRYRPRTRRPVQAPNQTGNTEGAGRFPN